MGKFIITEQSYREILHKLESMEAVLKEKQKKPSEVFFDNQEFVQLMNVSKRTSQSWRDQQLIGFSQVGSKIYYKLSDILAMLEKFKVPAIR